jgi:tetratricopeptide repeat protein 30
MSLLETVAKHMLVLRDATMNEILNFLDQIEVHGRKIKTVIDPLEEANP